MPGLDCRIAEGMVNRYIRHTLSVEETEEFLDHIEHCASCYDELETYFIVHEATQQLDEGKESRNLDFKKLLEEDIKKSRRYIRQKRVIRVAAGVLAMILAAALVIFVIYFILHLGS